MKIIRATHLGMCFGVKDAIALAMDTARRQPLTILGDLVHNTAVLEELRAAGIQFEHRPEAVRTATVMITAHGASERLIRQTQGQGFHVLQATCPLVHFAHRRLQSLVAQGFHPVVIGLRDHVEVRGLTGDLPECDVIISIDDIAQLQPRAKFGVVAQTTQPIAKVRRLVQSLREHFPAAEVRFADTVCQPTKQRQSAASELARQCDLVLVLGGAHSNNTRELVQTCRQFCPRVHHVQSAADLHADWFHPHDVVGITAGTSTPDHLIDELEQTLTRIQKEQHENCLV